MIQTGYSKVIVGDTFMTGFLCVSYHIFVTMDPSIFHPSSSNEWKLEVGKTTALLLLEFVTLSCRE